MPQTANPTGFLRRQKVVTEVAQTARVLFAWNEDTRPSIRIGVVNMASVRAPGEPHPPAIDVEVTTPIADALATDEPPLGSAA
jgi:hypothetical protein